MTQPNVLNARFAETVNQPGRYGDGHGGHGLALNVKPMNNGRLSKSWVQRIRVAGRVTNIGLGAYPMLKLAEARRKALKNRRNIAQGLDPRAGGVPTFQESLERVLDVQRPNWRNPKSEKQWRASLNDLVAHESGPLATRLAPLIHRPPGESRSGFAAVRQGTKNESRD